METCLACSPQIYSIFRVKIGLFPSNGVLWEEERRAILRVEKDNSWIRGSKTQNSRHEYKTNKGKHNKTKIGLITRIGPPKGQMVLPPCTCRRWLHSWDPDGTGPELWDCWGLLTYQGWVHQNRASPLASDFSPQTRVSKGILQWESVLSILITEKIAVRQQVLIVRESSILGLWT